MKKFELQATAYKDKVAIELRNINLVDAIADGCTILDKLAFQLAKNTEGAMTKHEILQYMCESLMEANNE